MRIDYSPHTYPRPISMGINMGIPIPTAALKFTVLLFRIHSSGNRKREHRPISSTHRSTGNNYQLTKSIGHDGRNPSFPLLGNRRQRSSHCRWRGNQYRGVRRIGLTGLKHPPPPPPRNPPQKIIYSFKSGAFYVSQFVHPVADYVPPDSID